MKRHTLIILMMLMAGSGAVWSAPKPGGRPSLSLTYRGAYDSNILHYSGRDKDRFLNQTEINPSPIRSLDDWRSDLKVSLAYAVQPLYWGVTEFQAIGDFAGYGRNSIKNFGWLSASVQQEFPRDISATFGVFYEPDYFIRDFRDIHSGEFHHCSFTLGQYSAKASYRPTKSLEAIVTGRRKKYAYNGYFTEYDGVSYDGDLEAVLRHKGWRFSAGWGYAIFDNTGFNSKDRLPPAVNPEDTESGQGDWRANGLNLSARHNFKVAKRKCHLAAEVDWQRRYYTTKRTANLDPIHYGRRDLTVDISIFGGATVTKQLDLEAGAIYENRDTNAADPTASAVKTFHRWGPFLDLTYQIW